MAIDINGPRCSCGNYGCLETYIRPNVITSHIKDAASEGKTPVLMEICGNDTELIDMENIFISSTKGDIYVMEYLNQIALYLGVGITNLINIFNPKIIVLGGVLSLAGKVFQEQVDSYVKNRLLNDYQPNIPIVLSTNGFYACAVGGVAFVINELLKNPVNWDKHL
jgi:predicted NBD/HSP70 family sugar kinase